MDNQIKKFLVVVDMQNDFITGTLSNPDAQAIIPNVAARIKQARENGETVIWTMDTHNDNYMNTQEGNRLPIPHCIKPQTQKCCNRYGTDEGWAITPALSPLPDDKFIEKRTFGSIELPMYINSRRAVSKISQSQVEITFIGICTDICVISNAIFTKTIMPEARIIVEAACCAGVSKQAHEIALSAMENVQIDVVRD